MRKKIDELAIEKVTAKEKQELNRRQSLYRGDRPKPVISGRTIILIDDGLATGATMRVAIAALHKQQPAKIIVAVPVSSLQTYQDIKSLIDEIICVDIPSPFYCVGLWYEKFTQTTDQEVSYLLNKAASRQLPFAFNN